MTRYSYIRFTRRLLPTRIRGMLTKVIAERLPERITLRPLVEILEPVLPKDLLDVSPPSHRHEQLVTPLRQAPRRKHHFVEALHQPLAVLVASDVRADRRRRILGHARRHGQDHKSTTETA
jgi:hypothetical protein